MHVFVADLHEDDCRSVSAARVPAAAGRAGRSGTSGCPAPRCRGTPGSVSGSGGQVFILAVLHVALVDERLEVGAVLDAVGRVDVDHLHLAGHALLFQQRVHHQQAVARDQAVGPAVGVLVELDRLAQRRVLVAACSNKRHLRRQPLPLRLRTASMMVRGSMRS